MEITLEGLAEFVKGKVIRGDPHLVLTGFATLDDSLESDVSFYSDKRYYQSLSRTQAGAIFVAPDFPAGEIKDLKAALIEVAEPTRALTEVVIEFGPKEKAFEPAIHPTAVISEKAKLDRENVRIGPHAVIEDDVSIGGRTEIGAGTFVGEGAVIGEGCWFAPNVTIYGCCKIGDRVVLHGGAVLGADGFGFELVDGRREKVNQIGIVQIDDDVEIGSNSTIDRARLGRTWLKEGVKLDNQVQIGHNCVIGEHTVVAAQTGIGGSTILDHHVTCGARVGMAGHLHLGHDIFISGHSGVTGNLKANDTYLGFPARPAKQMRKSLVLAGRLHLLLERIKKLEMKAGIGAGGAGD